METVTINPANVRKAYNAAKDDLKQMLATIFGGSVISQNPMDFGSYEELCEADGIDPVKSLPYQNPTTKKQVSCNGLFKLETIYEAFNKRCGAEFNELWEPDFTTVKQLKRYPWHDYNPSLGAFVFTYTNFTYTLTGLGARLCTDTDEKSAHIAKKFNREWNNF